MNSTIYCKFDSHVVPSMEITSSNVSCPMPNVTFSAETVSLSLSQNDLHFIHVGKVKLLRSKPELDFITPASGPINGSTSVRLHGNNFANYLDVHCVFGNHGHVRPYYVESNSIYCLTPPSINATVMNVGIEMDGVRIESDIVFNYFPAPIIHSISPTWSIQNKNQSFIGNHQNHFSLDMTNTLFELQEKICKIWTCFASLIINII